MRYISIFFIILAFLAGCAPTTEQKVVTQAQIEPVLTLRMLNPPSGSISIEELNQFVFKLVNAEGKVMGTAFASSSRFDLKRINSRSVLIDTVSLLTADHVADTTSKDIYYLEQNNLRFKIDRIFQAYTKADIAIIESNEFNTFRSSITITPPYIDCDLKSAAPLTDVISINNSNYDDFSTNIYTKGFISKVQNERIIMHLPLTTAGASGAPVFLNTTDKKIIGTVTEVKYMAKSKENTGVVYAVSGQAICDALIHYYRIAFLNTGLQ